MHFKRTLVTLMAAAAAMAIFAAACGGDDDTSSNGDTVGPKATATSATAGGSGGDSGGKVTGYRPCDLLTKEEVEAVLGESLDEPETSITGNPLGQKLCWYGAASETSFAHVQLSVIREQDIQEALRKGGQSAKRLYTDGKALVEAGKAKDVPGVGDAAYRHGSSLTVLSGGTLLTVSANIRGTDAADLSTDILKGLAQKALARVPK